MQNLVYLTRACMYIHVPGELKERGHHLWVDQVSTKGSSCGLWRPHGLRSQVCHDYLATVSPIDSYNLLLLLNHRLPYLSIYLCVYNSDVMDDFMAHAAVGLRAGQVSFGSFKSDVSKINNQSLLLLLLIMTIDTLPLVVFCLSVPYIPYIHTYRLPSIIPCLVLND